MKALSLFLQSRGYYAPPVTFPAVPLNKSCIRVTLNRLHEEDQMLGLLDAISSFHASEAQAPTAYERVELDAAHS